MKFKNYVKIDYGNGQSKYITSVDNSTRTFRTEDGANALAFSLTSAKDMVFCLACNYYCAYIAMHPECHTVTNPEKENEE